MTKIEKKIERVVSKLSPENQTTFYNYTRVAQAAENSARKNQIKDLSGGIKSFVNYELLFSKYSTGQMYENILKLKEYDIFHGLLAANPSRANEVKERFPGLPIDFINWLEACDGGMLFDTLLLTTKPSDEEHDLSIGKHDHSDSGLWEGRSLADDWFVFSAALHSDVFYFDMNKRDGKVYQWDVEKQKVYAVWPTFENWITDQINEAAALIADNLLTPLDMKLKPDSLL